MTSKIQRQFDRLAFNSLIEDTCPDADRLAAYILGALSGTEQLSIAAHVRDCPFCQHDVVSCRPPEPRPRMMVARLMPSLLVGERRSGAYRANIRQFVAADLIVEVTIAPPIGDYWRITGQLVRDGVGLADRAITLRSRRRRYERMSDQQGFFTFEEVPAGRYTLTVTDGPVLVQIRALTLSLDEDA